MNVANEQLRARGRNQQVDTNDDGNVDSCNKKMRTSRLASLGRKHAIIFVVIVGLVFISMIAMLSYEDLVSDFFSLGALSTRM